MVLKAIAVVAALFLFGQVARADQIAGSSMKVENWSIAAYDKNGRFSHCAMSTPYRSGITMLFSVSSDFSWRVGWTHASWNFTRGQGVDLVVFVDDAGPYTLRATATTEKLALAELPAKAAVFDLMRKGYRMSVRAQGNSYAFNLDGTYAALTEILACAGRYNSVAARPSSPPPSQPLASAPAPMVAPQAAPQVAPKPPAPVAQPVAPSRPSGEVTVEQRIEATKVVANILAQGDMTNFRILSAKEIAELNIDYVTRSHVAWRAEGIFGTLRVVPTRVSLQEANAQIIGDDVKACKGKFASGSTPDEKSPKVLRLFTACEEGGKMFEYRYTLVPVSDGTNYLFATVGRVDGAGAGSRTAKVETILRQAVYDVMKE